MNWQNAVKSTLLSRRVWLWELMGIIIYGIPVLIRFATHNITIPLLDFPGYWSYWFIFFIPSNLLEKVLVNAFFPGGAGAVLGETFVGNLKGTALNGKVRYASRFLGAMFQVSVLSFIQYFGFQLWLMPLGYNLFESVIVLPLNYVLAALSIFTPDVLNLAKKGIMKVKGKLAVGKIVSLLI
jgi:hypothetical protein